MLVRMWTSVSLMEESTGLSVVLTQSVRTTQGPTDVSANQGSNMLASHVWTSMNVWRSPTFAAMSVSTCGDRTGVIVVRDTNCLKIAGHV